MNKSPNKKIVLIGAGGHGKVCFDTLSNLDLLPIAILDPKPTLDNSFKEIEHIKNDASFMSKFNPKSILLANGIGMIPGKNKSLRSKIFNQFKSLGFSFINIIHPSAIISSTTIIQEGAHVMAGSVVQSNSFIGKNVIINTRSSIDHDNFISDHSHIACGSTLCGNVRLGKNVFIGAGSVILNNINIEDNKIIPAGSIQNHK